MKYVCLGLDEYINGTVAKPPQIFYKFKDETGKVIRQDFYTDIRLQYTSLNLGLVTQIHARKIADYLCRESPWVLTGDPEVKLSLPTIPNLYDVIHYYDAH